MAVVSIKFKEDGKPYFFECENLQLEKDDYVIVETEKGMQFGKRDVRIELEKI